MAAGQEDGPTRVRRAGRRRGAARAALLALPVLGLAPVPLYAGADPRWGAVPLFYWYQLAWIPASVVCLAVARRLTPEPPAARAGPARLAP